MNDLLNYNLIGIGEFSHGIIESWQFRFNLLKYAMKNTNKNIIIFNEMSIWQADNIMNNTIWSIKDNKFINYKGIKLAEPIQNNNYIGGKLWQYVNHAMESNIFLKIIKYIRKHKDRIKIIGIDNDTIDRDYDMYKIIMKNYKPSNINFLWDIAANMIPHHQFDANIERLAEYWQRTIGPVSYQTGYDREYNHHLGYFFMFNYETPNYDDRYNHIHIFSSFENENDDNIGFNYSLKVGNRHMFLNGNEINQIIIDTGDFNKIDWQTIVRDRLNRNIHYNPNFYIRNGLANNNTIGVDKYVRDNNNYPLDYKTGDIIAYECGIMFSQIAKIALILQYITTTQTLPTT
jgi:hypothetical protein